MKLIRAIAIFGAVVLPLTLAESGCSSGPGTGGGTGGGTGADGGGIASDTRQGGSPGATATGGPATNEATGADGGASDSTCAATSTGSACEQCCASNHSQGYATVIEALLTCACSPTGGCAAACASSACASPPKQPTQGDACDACLKVAQTATDGGLGACDQPVATACDKDPDCHALFDCAQPCLSMP